ncbi:MAG TPA: excinuclease ABC subunit UvrA, partial [Thermodesulfovibrionales bacterium]|nr:excinuclease ABC subunit UvrA [Thermodesulfovibrionales bacterium]
GGLISTRDPRSIIDSVMLMPPGTRVQVLAPIVRDRKGEYRKELAEMRSEGFLRARIDGVMVDLTEEVTLKKQKRHTVEIVVDRLIIKHGAERKIQDALDVALRYSDTVVINLVEEKKDIPFSRAMSCMNCGTSFPDINPRLFSFNSSYGACTHCHGLGITGLGNAHDPFPAGTEEDIALLPSLEDLKPCRSCGGMRLRPEALAIKIQDMNIGEFSRFTVTDALAFVNTLGLSERELAVSSRVLKEVKDRLSFLRKVGLGYLTLDRMSLTLSGGEAQRIRLATQMGSSLTGVLYVLDEPSIGLHPRDCRKLLESLSSIRDDGNTIIIVEHDEETIRWADHVVDIGPGAGARGGWVVAEGTPAEIQANPHSLTGKYLKGELNIPLPELRRKPSGFIRIRGAAEYNLKNIDVDVPLGIFTCVTGVSGSGKSTLIVEILYKALMKTIHKSRITPGKHREVTGLEKIDNVICVDQSPLGRTPRSNPATYSGVFTPIREIFAQAQESKVRGFSSSRFSFNVSGGRCEKCRGGGLLKVVMHFLPDAYVQCDSCKSRRYNRETLNIRYRDRDISEVLSMTVSEAREFFSVIPAVRQKLEILEDVGLGYLQLGQPAPTLSGGEAQRLRLSRELAKRSTGNTLYILDEPTTGLHFVDIQRLLDVVNSLVDRGNTVIVIEHNLDVIKSADYLIDLGPEGGEIGGRLVASGTPEDVCLVPDSSTGRFLKNKLAFRVASVA